MKIVILSGVANEQLGVLTEGLPVGAIHFGVKPLMAYTAQQLESIDDNIFVCGSQKIDALIQHISPFLGWQASINALNLQEETISEEILWLRDDVLYNIDFYELLKKIRQLNQAYVSVVVDNVAVMFYQNIAMGSHLFDFNILKKCMTTHDYFMEIDQTLPWQYIQLSCEQATIISSWKKFHHVVMSVLLNTYNYVSFDPHHEDKKLIIGWHTKVNKSSLLQDHAYLGDRVYIHDYAQLKGNVILSNGCFIDEFVDIENTLVMPNIYIGPHLNVKNSIVTSNKIIRIDTDIVIPIDEEKFIKKMVA